VGEEEWRPKEEMNQWDTGGVGFQERLGMMRMNDDDDDDDVHGSISSQEKGGQLVSQDPNSTHAYVLLLTIFRGGM